MQDLKVPSHSLTQMGIAIALGAVIGTLAFAVVVNKAGAVSDPPITCYYPSCGWAAQSHAQGHDGYGSSNSPTWYGGAAKDGGTDACASANRYNNLTGAASWAIYSTGGTSELPDWYAGLILNYVGCGVNASSRTLITTFVNGTMGGTPGFTYHSHASAGQCSGQGLSYPCGDWSTTSQVDTTWWSSRTDAVRQELLLHEWGHAFGMDDYCNGQVAMMNNGYAPCNWPSSGQYYAKDRQALYIIYGY